MRLGFFPPKKNTTPCFWHPNCRAEIFWKVKGRSRALEEDCERPYGHMTARMDLNKENPPDKNMQKQSPSNILGSWWIKQISPKTIQDTSSTPKKGGFFMTLSSIIMVQWKNCHICQGKTYRRYTEFFCTELLDIHEKRVGNPLGSCLEWCVSRVWTYDPPRKRKEQIWRIDRNLSNCLFAGQDRRSLSCHRSHFLPCLDQRCPGGFSATFDSWKDNISGNGHVDSPPPSRHFWVDDGWFSELLVWWNMDSSSGGVHIYSIHNLPLFRIWLLNFTPEATQISTYFNLIFRNTPLQKPRKEAATHQNKTKTLENKLLLISIHFTLKTSHICLKKSNPRGLVWGDSMRSIGVVKSVESVHTP